MTGTELISHLMQGATTPERTCDTVKAGDAERQIRRVGVTMFATVDTVRRAREWGADFLIVHEPTYYDHMDIFRETPVTLAKRAFIEESGITVYRYHDHAHFRAKDLITEGEMRALGLTGRLEPSGFSASYILTADTPVTALELAERMERQLGIAHQRIAGSRNRPCRRIGCCFGTPRGVLELLQREDIDMVLTGEVCEWMLAEYARDADALGMTKSLLVMGHIGSERDGMKLLAERLQNEFATDFETRYFECGEVYTYTDSQ